MAIKRNQKSKETIREMLEETDMKFVMLNNGLIDHYLQEGKVLYRPKCDNKENKRFFDYKGSEIKENKLVKVNGKDYTYATFNDKDLIIIILIKFLQQINYRGYTVELANYLGMKGESDRRFKERIKKLSVIEGMINSEYLNKTKERIYYENPKKVPLITERSVEGLEAGKKRIFYQWFLNYDHDYKQVKENNEITHVAKNFFKVTIYDLDLYTNGILNEKEFITYLYFIKSHNQDDRKIWHSISKLSERVNIKNPYTTQKIIDRFDELRITDKFCNTEKKETWPLIHIDKPENYTAKLRNREDPSCHYRPVYNLSTLNRLSEQNPNIYEKEDEIDEPEVDMDELFA